MGSAVRAQLSANTKKILTIALIYSLALVLTGLVAGNVGESLNGLWTIVKSPTQLTLDFFKIGTVGGTFINSGLVGLSCVLVLFLSKAELSGTTLMAYFLTVGFSFFGINVMNIWPCFFGTWLFTRVMRRKFATQVNIALFSTSLAPFVSEMVCRHPVYDVLILKMALGVLVGAVAGFLMPILCTHGPNLHKGYSLYNAASVAGFIAIMLFSLMFRATGNEIPSNTDIGESHAVIVNAFCLGMSALMIIAGFILNGKSFKGYGKLIAKTGFKCDFTSSDGIGLTLVNIGVFGLFSAAYYHLAGAAFTSPTAGAMICLLAVAPCGAHAFNMLPIMVGYGLATLFCDFTLSTQAIIIGLCFSAAMIPIPGRFGGVSGVLAGLMHAWMVTSVATFHGGFLLYNGGFTAAITAIILVPVLENFFIPSDKLRLLPQLKKEN